MPDGELKRGASLPQLVMLRSLNIGVGGTVRPGMGVGVLTVGGNAGLVGGALEIDIDDTSPLKSDKLAIAGTLTASSSVLRFVTNGTPTQALYVIATYTGSAPTGFILKNAPSGYSVDFARNGNSIALVKTDLTPEIEVSLKDGDPFSSGTTIDFGTVGFGMPITKTLIVKNRQAGSLVITSFLNSGGPQFTPNGFTFASPAPSFPITLGASESVLNILKFATPRGVIPDPEPADLGCRLGMAFIQNQRQSLAGSGRIHPNRSRGSRVGFWTISVSISMGFVSSQAAQQTHRAALSNAFRPRFYSGHRIRSRWQ